MAIHPCCGGSLQTGSKIVAIVQIVVSVLALIGALIILATGVFFTAAASSIANSTNASPAIISHEISHSHGNSSDPHHDIDPAKVVTIIGAVAVIIGVVKLVSSILSLILSIVLWQGAKHRNVRNCRIWLIIRCVLMVISVVGFFGTGGISSHSFTAIEIILNMYCMWVVYEFINELREDESASMKRSMYTNKA